MPGVARLNDSISGTTASNYCCTNITRDSWQVCVEWDENGNCIRWETRYGSYYCNRYSSTSITGQITSNVSNNVYVNGRPVAFVGSVTSEQASTCAYPNYSPGPGSGNGTISGGSSKIFVNGKRLARQGDAVTPHSGTATITTGSSNVIAS